MKTTHSLKSGRLQNANDATGISVRRRSLLTGVGATGLSAALVACSSGNSQESPDSGAKGNTPGGDYYWVSHGAPNDQIWVLANQGAKQAGSDLGVSVHTSFHNNDVAAQKQAITSAIAAKAKGIVTTAPQPKVLANLVKQARDAGIPVVMTNSDDTSTGRLAYVGADLKKAGTMWAQHLVDQDMVSKGDTVWLPVEAAGASYQVLETSGIKSVFDPLNIKTKVFQTGGEPADIIKSMQNYINAHGQEIDAIIGLGDPVMSNIQRVFESVNWKPGKVPVVGWGNSTEAVKSVQNGYIDAALWQYPQSQGYQPIALLRMHNAGIGIGYDITTLSLYGKKNASKFESILAK